MLATPRFIFVKLEINVLAFHAFKQDAFYTLYTNWMKVKSKTVNISQWLAELTFEFLCRFDGFKSNSDRCTGFDTRLDRRNDVRRRRGQRIGSVFGHQQTTGTFRRSTAVSIGRSHPVGHGQQVNQVTRPHVGRARNLAMRHSTDDGRAVAADENGATVARWLPLSPPAVMMRLYLRYFHVSGKRARLVCPRPS